MAFKSVNSRPQSAWKKVMTLTKSLNSNLDADDIELLKALLEQVYLKSNNYKGRLLWEEYGQSQGDSRFFQINSASLFDPKDGDPDFALQNICINLQGEGVSEVFASSSDSED